MTILIIIRTRASILQILLSFNLILLFKAVLLVFLLFTCNCCLILVNCHVSVYDLLNLCIIFLLGLIVHIAALDLVSLRIVPFKAIRLLVHGHRLIRLNIHQNWIVLLICEVNESFIHFLHLIAVLLSIVSVQIGKIMPWRRRY